MAVIPRPAKRGLVRALAHETDISVVQHGFAHRNHARPGARKMELGTDRPADLIGEELLEGRRRMLTMFGDRFLPALVPPWNRIAPRVVDGLPELGYRGVSTFKARRRAEIRPGLIAANSHVDIIDWARTRAFGGTDAALDTALTHLVRRRVRADRVDPDEPTGLLTHHLAHDPACWDFIAAFVSRTARHPAARWLAAGEVFARR
jgi:hypothetical protein